jgi:hypothetical protein
MSVVKLSDHCCQGGDGSINPDAFSIEDLTIETLGERSLRFSPLGNLPRAPTIALVGITPGSQSEKFADYLREMPIEKAAAKAAFGNASDQANIKAMLRANGFADALNLHIPDDLNDSPDIWTTSLVKCCVKRAEGYEYKAPVLANTTWATTCIERRFLPDIERFESLRYVIVFGKPGWAAVTGIEVQGSRVLDWLSRRNLTVLNFPHFSQNFGERALFECPPGQEAPILLAHPTYRRNLGRASELRSAVLREVQRIQVKA